MDLEMVINRGEAPDEVLEISKTEFGMLKKLEGAITKKKRKKSSILCGAEQTAPRRIKIQPIIIHAVTPPLIHAEPSSFMRIVQSLTGCAATRLRCEEEEAALMNRAESPMSCGAATIESLKGRRCAATTVQVQWLDEEAAMTRAGSPVWCGGAVVGSPCSSTTSTTTATTISSISGDVNVDANAGFMESFQELIAENEVLYMESRDEGPISSPSADGSSCSLLLDSNEHHVFFNSGAASASHAEEPGHLFLADSDVHPQDLESTLDSYLAHLLSSYDRDAYCKFTSISALLADVSDPLLL